jgi:hypothetical protein
MAKRRTTKTEKLLREIQKAGKTGLSHKEIVKFLLRGTGRKYGPETRRLFDSRLYGTNSRSGVLERCDRNFKNGNYTLSKKATTEGPFTESLAQPVFSAYEPSYTDEDYTY